MKGNITVIGIGKSSNNEGVRDGAVVNINSVVDRLMNLLELRRSAYREVRLLFRVSGKDVQRLIKKV